jgi:hypothetical protein
MKPKYLKTTNIPRLKTKEIMSNHLFLLKSELNLILSPMIQLITELSNRTKTNVGSPHA